MNLLELILGRERYIDLHRALTCRFGFHTPRVTPSGQSANFCGRGCGKVFNPNAYQDYIVTLKDGSVSHVSAVNEYHAGSVVVYGPYGTIDEHGQAREPVRVHRENIATIKLKDQFSKEAS
jgi:hypothetical protein